MRTISLTVKVSYFIIRGIMLANIPTRPRIRGLQALACLALIASSSAWADTFNFTALPSDVAGPAGSTVGWGYTISNASTTSWLVLTALNAGVFDHGSADSLFDFPTLAPGATVSISFDPVNSLGLYELAWSATAPTGFVNDGFFTLSAEWWDGDPLTGGNFLSDAPDGSAAYSATVTGSTSVPEPAVTWVVSWIAALLFLQKARDIRAFLL
ncbi:MAG TPA: hypothetical protein VKT49_19680 [Bryobacteraceae bacterium]|nr:hypothetical protein [Bryobacteraceae bacterium]